MRNQRNTTDAAAARQGPLASLMRAAEPLDQLSAAERERIKLRLRGELAQTRPVARMRLLTAMAGLGLLLAGGVAVAERWGLIRWPSIVWAPSPGGGEVTGKSPRPPRAHPRPTIPSVPAGANFPEAVEPIPAELRAPAPTPSVPGLDEVKTVRPAAVEPSARPRRVLPATAKSPAFLREAPARELAPTPLVLPAPAFTPPTPAAPAPSADRTPPAPLPAPRPSLAMVTPVDVHRRGASSTASAKPNPQDLLGQAMRNLRRQHDPAAALDLLARHAALYPESPLSSERNQLEAEALLALGRYPEALLRLDGMDLGKVPRGAERMVVRGELRAQARRWNQAAADFDQALAHFRGSSPWHERALWGRATARARAGDRDGSRSDVKLYLQTYPQGRFAVEAARLAEHP